jgi:hypothetical protein
LLIASGKITTIFLFLKSSRAAISTQATKTAPEDMPLAEALARAEELYFDAALRFFHKF